MYRLLHPTAPLPQLYTKSMLQRVFNYRTGGGTLTYELFLFSELGQSFNWFSETSKKFPYPFWQNGNHSKVRQKTQ